MNEGTIHSRLTSDGELITGPIRSRDRFDQLTSKAATVMLIVLEQL
jgi:hypothetical protein